MDELKPCPHCGGKAEWDSADTDGSCRIECTNCGATTSWLREDEDAIAAWNRRAPDRLAELEAENAKLRAALAEANKQIIMLEIERDAENDYGKRMEAAVAELIKIEAEANRKIERLREALKWYADGFCEYGKAFEGCGKMQDVDCSGCNARAALAETDAPGENHDA